MLAAGLIGQGAVLLALLALLDWIAYSRTRRRWPCVRAVLAGGAYLLIDLAAMYRLQDDHDIWASASSFHLGRASFRPACLALHLLPCASCWDALEG